MFELNNLIILTNEIFPATASILGQERLSTLLLDLSKNSSKADNNPEAYLIKLLPRYLANLDLKDDEKYLQDLIKFESYLFEAKINKSEGITYDIEDLIKDISESPDKISFILDDSVRLISSKHPLMEIRAAILSGQDGLKIKTTEDFFVIDHVTEVVRVSKVDKLTFKALEVLESKGKIEDIAGELFIHSAPDKLESTLKEILSSLWVSSYTK